MNIRERQEQWELGHFSTYASFSVASLGRDRHEPACDVRTVYQRDRDRILHCKAFRRLKDKTQVFLAPVGDHYRTRLTHTLEVAQIARTIAKALRLNEELTEAIALGHDLGHTPFGHAGERALSQICSNKFQHHEQSVRVIERLEKKGQGLNLTHEVRDGILNHQTSGMPYSLEGKVVRLSDKIAYINHDIDDAIRAKILREEDIPTEYTDVLGNSVRIRLNCLIHDIIESSEEKPDIIMSPEVKKAMFGLRKYMYESVYTNPVAKMEEEKGIKLIKMLFEHYIYYQEQLPEEYQEMVILGDDEEQVVCDYISGMTDRYAIAQFQEIFEPKSWEI